MTSDNTLTDGGPRPHGGLTWLWIAGIASIAIGGVAILFPLAATIAAELLIGAALVSFGAVELVRAFLRQGIGSTLWSLLLGIAGAGAGVVLLLFPLQGVLTLTIVLASFVLAGGILKIAAAFAGPSGAVAGPGAEGSGPRVGSGWLVASGALSVLLGVLLLTGWPGTAVWALGLLLGIDLVFLGAAEIATAIALRRAARGA